MTRLGAKPILLVMAAALAALWSCPALAQVSGTCANCHTMHNSQDGSAVSGSGPYAQLLINNCVGCHSSTDGDVWKDSVTGAPIVYNTAEPTFGADAGDGKKQGLAGGNFYWVSQDDSFGHNLFVADATLSDAPGNPGGCGGACHSTFVGPACRGCHMDKMDYILGANSKGFHHADDSAVVINSASQGWYRFLEDKMSWTGVSGIEDPDWEHSPSSTAHNEYLGIAMDKTTTGGMQRGMMGAPNTVTGFCTGCHGNFHIQNENAGGTGDWVRHPSDAVIPASGEYANYTTYDPLTPVARPSLSAVSETVTPGTDMVFCLSCHRAHGSPYADMLRFPYNQMQAGGGGLDGKGCFACHTAKDGS